MKITYTGPVPTYFHGVHFIPNVPTPVDNPATVTALKNSLLFSVSRETSSPQPVAPGPVVAQAPASSDVELSDEELEKLTAPSVGQAVAVEVASAGEGPEAHKVTGDGLLENLDGTYFMPVSKQWADAVRGSSEPEVKRRRKPKVKADDAQAP